MKENQPELLAEAERLTGGPVEMTWSTAQDEFQLWHAPETYWPTADRSLRVVKTFRIQKEHRVQLTPQEVPKGKKGPSLSLVFYHRQVVSHARQTPPTFSEMARLLTCLFLLPPMDSS